MKKSNTSFPAPWGEELVWGWGYLIFQLVLLPGILTSANGLLEHPLSKAELNFTFFLVNFLAVFIIFRRFLGASALQALRHPAEFCQAVILGVVAYYACVWVTTWCIGKLDPGFTNANDDSLSALSRANWYIMFIGTVILVPPVEECFYRGLVFRPLYGKNKVFAYLFSMTVFALIHIIGFINQYSPLGLVLCFFQYLPAGLCLAWSYAKGETILSPIVIHALINARTIHALR